MRASRVKDLVEVRGALTEVEERLMRRDPTEVREGLDAVDLSGLNAALPPCCLDAS